MTDRCTAIGCSSLDVIGVCRQGGHGFCAVHGTAGAQTCDRHRLKMRMLLGWGVPKAKRRD